jgi:hypothetical protein
MAAWWRRTGLTQPHPALLCANREGRDDDDDTLAYYQQLRDGISTQAFTIQTQQCLRSYTSFVWILHRWISFDNYFFLFRFKSMNKFYLKKKTRKSIELICFFCLRSSAVAMVFQMSHLRRMGQINGNYLVTCVECEMTKHWRNGVETRRANKLRSCVHLVQRIAIGRRPIGEFTWRGNSCPPPGSPDWSPSPNHNPYIHRWVF